MSLRSGEEILADISSTLDQLIQNAEAIDQISLHSLKRCEVEALQKTQASLIARILHMENSLDSDQKQELLRKRPTATETIQKEDRRVQQIKSKTCARHCSRLQKTESKKEAAPAQKQTKEPNLVVCERTDRALNVLWLREHSILEILAVGHDAIFAGDAFDGRIEKMECSLRQFAQRSPRQSRHVLGASWAMRSFPVFLSE